MKEVLAKSQPWIAKQVRLHRQGEAGSQHTRNA